MAYVAIKQDSDVYQTNVGVMFVIGCAQVVAVLSDVGSSHTDAVLSVLRARREEIHTALLNRTISISFATLQDFDWQLKVMLYSLFIFGMQLSLTMY